MTNNDKNSNIIIQLIYLISCGLNSSEVSKDDVKDIDLELLYRLAKSHSITVLIYETLKKNCILDDADKNIIEIWKNEADKAIYKSLLLDKERESVLNEMEERKIWHVPLKGSMIKNWYPDRNMREMSDNDILYDKEYKSEIKDIFVKRGYKVKSEGQGVHDVYMKLPVYNFEMHSALFSDEFDEKFSMKYKNVKDMLVLDEGKKYRYHFSNEDLYVYIIAHSYKHYKGRGTGLRTLMDNYVINLKNRKYFDLNYIDSELKDLGIKGYERLIRDSANKFFAPVNSVSEIKLTENEISILYDFCNAGVYGNMRNYIANILRSMEADSGKTANNVKIKYCVSRLFPDREWCRNRYEFFYKYPFCIPILWIFRIIRAAFCRRKKIYSEFSAIIKYR